MKNKLLLEEILSSITHGIGVVLSTVGLVILLVIANRQHNLWEIIGFSIFGISLILMFLMSTLFHSLSFTKAKKVFLVLDQSSIFLLIAGTYTPIALIVLRGWIGWVLLCVVWSIAIVGIVLKAVFMDKFKIVLVVLYLLLGWAGLIVIRPLFMHLSLSQIYLLILGGLFYSSGVIFYAWKRLPFNHAIWHLFVLAGSACHFFVISGL
ncbi:MAG TPA: hemolysin III family protein [Patescibacteria group bacterium]|nr:hemolysin III family protein [Patescibacteria group bacterium]